MSLSTQWRAEGPHSISLFHSMKGRRPALSSQWRAEGPHSISLFHSVKGRRPALSSQWFLQHLHESDSDFTVWGVAENPWGLNQKILFDKSCLRCILFHNKSRLQRMFFIRNFLFNHSEMHFIWSFLFCLPSTNTLVVKMIRNPILSDLYDTICAKQ